MRVDIAPSRAIGTVKVPTSKSMAHRLLICAGLANGKSRICGITRCEDVLATVDCLRALGAEINYDGDCAVVHGINPCDSVSFESLVCRESGSTLRFLIPVALLSGKSIEFCGSKRLFERPMTVYEEIAKKHGMTFTKGENKITACGPLKGGEISIRADVSSQFISGLLFALPLCQEDSRIKLTTDIESMSYIHLTISAMKKYGVEAYFEDEKTIFIRGGQSYIPTDSYVEGDFSAAAFCDGFNLLGGDVKCEGLDDNSLQGDKVYRTHLDTLSKGYSSISLKDCPDLGPILFALAAALHGGEFTDTARLRIKESDRADAMANELKKFGADISVYENRVIINPAKLHAPREILRGHNDHRIVMALSVLCSVFGGSIDDAQAVSKSYPDFFKHIISLGIKANINET